MKDFPANYPISETLLFQSIILISRDTQRHAWASVCEGGHGEVRNAGLSVLWPQAPLGCASSTVTMKFVRSKHGVAVTRTVKFVHNGHYRSVTCIIKFVHYSVSSTWETRSVRGNLRATLFALYRAI